MHRHFFWHRAVLGTVATLSLLVIGPARAQLQRAVEAPTVSSAPAAAHDSAACTVVADQIRFDFPLPRTAQLLVSGVSIKIVAFGSSSTYGAGASTAAASYPRRLAEELVHLFPGHKFTVLNRGVSGEELSDMLARLHTAVIREKPDLELWPTGSHSMPDDKAVH